MSCCLSPVLEAAHIRSHMWLIGLRPRISEGPGFLPPLYWNSYPLRYLIEGNKQIWSLWLRHCLLCSLLFPCSGIVVVNSFQTKASLSRSKMESWQLKWMCTVGSKENRAHHSCPDLPPIDPQSGSILQWGKYSVLLVSSMEVISNMLLTLDTYIGPGGAGL